MKNSTAQILKTFFERKKAARPGFSLRSFAKALDVSPSFASGMIAGKKTVPLARVNEVAKLLELDQVAVQQLKRSSVEATLKAHGLDVHELIDEPATKKYRMAPKSQFSVMNPWYNIAIMDLTTCANFKKDNDWIAQRLGISKYQVEHSLVQLLQHGLLQENKDGYKKVDAEIRMSLNESHAEIRKFHAQMMDKAKEELLTKTTQDAFERREIAGITIAANPKHILKARMRLTEAIHEVADILSQGECTELFQINAQLFSLLTSEKS